MDIKLTAAIAAAKVSAFLCKCLKHSGTSFSGKIALKIDRRILTKLSKGYHIIMVTGTNGKTTTTKMVSEILMENKIRHITNKSGANLVSGITSIFIEASNLFGKSKVSNAVVEVDEATLDRVTGMIQPDILIVTNFFRDQLDRYGELYTTLKKVGSGIEKSPKAKLILNADDSLCSSLGKKAPNQAVYFGIEAGVTENLDASGISTASFCIFCKSRYDYSYKVLGHLGGYRCTGCGFERPETDVKCVEISELTSDYSEIHFEAGGKNHTARINLPGLYNVYNALAAYACGQMMGLPVENSIRAVARFENSFGRMETIPVGDKNIKIILAKNPTGLNQILNYLLTEKNDLCISFIINDKVLDGTDISWLWDVDFEKLKPVESRISKIYTSGIRAEDMSVRLKYAGISTDRIEIIKDFSVLTEKGLASTNSGATHYIIPTYTAMMEIRRFLKEKYGLKEFWQ